MVGLPDKDGPTMSDEQAEDGPTVQATVSPDVANAAPSAPRLAPPRPGPPRPDSKPKLEPTPPTLPVSAVAATQEEEEQDSITATAPRVDPKQVLLAPIEGTEEDLQTEIKTMTGADGVALAAMMAAEAKAAPPPPLDDDPATMTAQAPSPSNAVPETAVSPLGDEPDDDGATVSTLAPTGSSPDLRRVQISEKSLMEPPTLTGVGDSPTKPGVGSSEAPTKSGVGPAPSTEKEYEPEDSITSRALAKKDEVDEYADDSVTAIAPSVGAVKGVLPTGPFGDDTDATTQRKGQPPASPADEEQESITQQAPGHLTNMLRVIASDRRSDPAAPVAAPPVLAPFEDDEPPENKTAVMPNAPMKNPASHPLMKHGTLQGMGPVAPPSSRPPGTAPLGASAAAAPRLDPGSESGLRVAHDSSSGEHASLGVILGRDARMSSGRVGVDSEGRIAHANTEPAVFPLAPDDMPIPTSPRYGLLVTVVAAVCIVIPVALYVYLTSNKEEALVPGVPTQPSADVVKGDDTIRQKFTKPTKKKGR